MAKSPEFPAYEFSQQLTSLSDFIVVCSQPDFLEWQLFFYLALSCKDVIDWAEMCTTLTGRCFYIKSVFNRRLMPSYN